MASNVWGPGIAAAYDAVSAPMFDPAVLGPTVDLLAELAGDGAALEFAVGTGRVALALHERGVAVSGIELSPHMVDQLRAKPGAGGVAVTIGDMTTTSVPGPFALVYLVFNTIMNVTAQAEQVAVFLNAAAHLRPGGCFLVEVVVPSPPLGAADGLGRVLNMRDDRVSIDTYDDPVDQLMSSHHWVEVGGHLVRHSVQFRYVWPAELELMGRVAGLRLIDRWSGWKREPFTARSGSEVAVFEKPE